MSGRAPLLWYPSLMGHPDFAMTFGISPTLMLTPCPRWMSLLKDWDHSEAQRNAGLVVTHQKVSRSLPLSSTVLCRRIIEETIESCSCSASDNGPLNLDAAAFDSIYDAIIATDPGKSCRKCSLLTTIGHHWLCIQNLMKGVLFEGMSAHPFQVGLPLLCSSSERGSWKVSAGKTFVSC